MHPLQVVCISWHSTKKQPNIALHCIALHCIAYPIKKIWTPFLRQKKIFETYATKEKTIPRSSAFAFFQETAYPGQGRMTHKLLLIVLQGAFIKYSLTVSSRVAYKRKKTSRQNIKPVCLLVSAFHQGSGGEGGGAVTTGCVTTATNSYMCSAVLPNHTTTAAHFFFGGGVGDGSVPGSYNRAY